MSITKNWLTGMICMLGLINPATVNAQEYAIGADLSFARQIESRGQYFKEVGKDKPVLEIFRDHGYNWIRLRLFHTPTELPNDLAYTIALAQDAKKMGYKFLLDYHYSDTWADPQKQFLPKAWEGKTHKQLVDSVYYYTRYTLEAFKVAGVMPDMVQVGNEISNGMLWPDGKLPGQWGNFLDLLRAGIKAVQDFRGTSLSPQIMVHIDKGGDKAFTKQFYDHIINAKIPFDVIGQSYYPWWHGSLLSLRENMFFMAKAYKKPIIVVEAAYCSSPTEYTKKAGPFPETPEGQREFLQAVNEIILQTPDHLGAGVFWWEPACWNCRGISTRDLFDEKGNALPAITVFDKFVKY
jgi:arabinogalactan endo-1,4-beta-galactosidase